MKLFSGSFSFTLILLLITAVLSSCSLPEAIPTASPTPEQTATPILPTATATPSPTPTETPLPEYLSVEPDSLNGQTITLRYSLDGKTRDTLAELTSRFNKENSFGITILAVPAYSMDELSAYLSEENTEETNLVIADSAWLRSQSHSKTTFADLSSFLTDPELALESDSITPIMPVMLAQENQEGNYFAIPLWAEPAFLFYNKTWAIELGFEDTPADLAAFAEQACAAGKGTVTNPFNARKNNPSEFGALRKRSVSNHSHAFGGCHTGQLAAAFKSSIPNFNDRPSVDLSWNRQFTNHITVMACNRDLIVCIHAVGQGDSVFCGIGAGCSRAGRKYQQSAQQADRQQNARNSFVHHHNLLPQQSPHSI